ncbi:MAG: DUF1801 domain-containing protein [bacterium]|nr:DUF1801 domain-containing protein [bacterium]
MQNEVHSYIERYSDEIQNLFAKLRNLVIESVPYKVDERLYAKLPSYYLGERFIRIIPFKDHINIEAKAIMEYKEQLKQYKLTPKGMLQIYSNEEIPESTLSQIFSRTLTKIF